MSARGTMRIPCAFLTLALVLIAATYANAWERSYRYPVKVRVSGAGVSDSRYTGARLGCGDGSVDWDVAAGASRNDVLCPKRGYNFEIGTRPFFSNLLGSAKVVSRGGEGTSLHFHGHLRIPSEKTLWEYYANLRLWDKVAVRLEYIPWSWAGPGHAASDGNFSGLPLATGDGIISELNITTLKVGADYDVSFGRDLVFGPNADLHLIKWMQKVAKDDGESMEFSQSMLEPAMGAHIRYEPTNTGYFSWFKPYVEGRFSWMSFHNLSLSTWNLGLGVAPPVSRNVDAGVRVGYKQWNLDGTRSRLNTNSGVEGMYLDLSLRF
jgi:hypothetical protein